MVAVDNDIICCLREDEDGLSTYQLFVDYYNIARYQKLPTTGSVPLTSCMNNNKETKKGEREKRGGRERGKGESKGMEIKRIKGF